MKTVSFTIEELTEIVALAAYAMRTAKYKPEHYIILKKANYALREAIKEQANTEE